MEKELTNLNSESQQIENINNSQVNSQSEGLSSDTKKNREFRSFTNTKSIEERILLSIQSFTIIDDKGQLFTNNSAMDLIASHQASKAQQNADNLCRRVRNFLQDPNYDVYVRYAQSSDSPKQYSSDWLKRTLAYALFPIPEKFTFNKVLYSVVPIIKEFEYDIQHIHDILTGTTQLCAVYNDKSEKAILPESNGIRVFVNRELFIDTCNYVIKELQIEISEDGVISALGSPLMKWVVKPNSLLKANSLDLTGINLF